MSRQATRGLPFRDWSEADYELWQRLTRSGGPFGVDGALSRLRSASLETLRNGYGFFLGHAARTSVDMQCAASAVGGPWFDVPTFCVPP